MEDMWRLMWEIFTVFVMPIVMLGLCVFGVFLTVCFVSFTSGNNPWKRRKLELMERTEDEMDDVRG